MPRSVRFVEGSKSLERVSRRALVPPLTITDQGHDNLELMAVLEYEPLKSCNREVLAMSDFTAEDRTAMVGAQAPADAAAFDTECRRV